jgi:hypothetical protein
MEQDAEAEAYLQFVEMQWDKAFISAQEKLGRDPTEEEVFLELDRLFGAECERLSEPPEYNGDLDE